MHILLYKFSLCLSMIIMVVFKCYFSREHIDLSLKTKNDVNIELGKNQQTKSTVHDAK